MLSRLRTSLIILVALAMFLVLGWNLEIDDRFEPARKSLSTNYGPLATMDVMERFMRQSGLSGEPLEILPGGSLPLLSTSVVSDGDFEPGWPLVSLVMTTHDLHDPDYGLLANPLERGRLWERRAHVSYFQEGQLVFDSRVGVRLHGGNTRRLRWEAPMLRIYFRESEGVDPDRPTVFDSRDRAVERWVLRSPPQPDFFSNAIAFEIARRNGALAPEFRLVRVILNGVHLGRYLLVEHISRGGWGQSHFGHDQFLMYVYRGRDGTSPASFRGYRDLERWARNFNFEMTMEEAAQYVDIDNLSRHLFTFIFCGERDWPQGAAVRDESSPRSKWQWVHFDLDHSFSADVSPPRADWQRFTFEPFLGYGPLNVSRDVRAVLFSRLMRDPGYLEYFARLVTDLQNHRINPAFLDSLVEKYAYTGRPPGTFGGVDMATFFRNRPDYVRRSMNRFHRVGPSHRVQLVGDPDDIAYDVDGYPEGAGYEGWYFEGQTVSVEITGPNRERLSHWLVNGERFDAGILVVPVMRNTTISPVF